MSSPRCRFSRNNKIASITLVSFNLCFNLNLGGLSVGSFFSIIVKEASCGLTGSGAASPGWVDRPEQPLDLLDEFCLLLLLLLDRFCLLLLLVPWLLLLLLD